MTRTVRQRGAGQPVVAIAFRGRPWPAVVADMIDGVVVINDLHGVQAARARDSMWESWADPAELAA